MKKLIFAMLLAIPVGAAAQGVTIGPNGSMVIGAPPGTFPCTAPAANSILCSGTIQGSSILAISPVPFASGAYAAFGYGQGSNEADIYSGGGGGVSVWTPNISGTAWLNILSLTASGTLTPANDVLLTAGNCYYFAGANQGICDDGSGGETYTATSTSTNGHQFFKGSTLLWQMDINGNLVNGSGAIIIPAGATGNTGTGNNVFSISPTLTGTPLAPTHGSCVSDTQIATGAYVANCAGGGSGVTSLALTTTGTSGASTGNISGATLTLNIPQYATANIAPVTLALPSGLAANGNTCYRWSGSVWGVAPATPATITMTGVVSSGVPSWVGSGLQGSTYLTTGWGPIGGLILNVWPSAANTVSWEVCNQTAGLINSGTPSFTIKASN